MRIDHKTMLEAFEETEGRGDVLSISREDLVRLKAVPFERFAPIFYQLFKWFVDGDETPLEDPVANAMLEGYKEHQRINARRRKAFLIAQQEKINKRWKKNECVNTMEYHGKSKGSRRIPRNTTEYQVKAKAKAEVKEEAKDSSSFTVGDEESRTDAAPPSPLSVAEAKKELMILAPPVNDERYSEDDMKYYEENRDEDYGDEDAAVEHALDVIDEAENDKARNALAKSCSAVGLNLFRRALFRFDTDVFQDERKGGKEKSFRSKGAALMARLKRLSAAVDALDEDTLDAVDAAEGGEEG